MSRKSGRTCSWTRCVLSVVISVSMAFGGVPMAAYAEAAEELVEVGSVDGNNKQFEPADADSTTAHANELAGAINGATEGAVGPEEQAPTYTWTIDDAGLLTITPAEGKDGTLPSNTESARGFYPWAAQSNDVRSIRVESGVKTQGSIAYLFANLPNLESVDLTGLNTSEATDTTGIFEGSGSLATFVVGSAYDLSKVDAIPVSRAKDGRWWSQGAKSWFAASEIAATRATTADTYASEGPAAEPVQQPAKEGSQNAGQPSTTNESANEKGQGQQQGNDGSGKETVALSAQDSGDEYSFENFTASCISVARFDNGDGSYTLRPWGIQLLDTNNSSVDQSCYDVTVEPTNNTNWGATVTVTFSAKQDNTWGYTGSTTATCSIGVSFDSDLLVAHNTVISREELNYLKSSLSIGNYYPDLTYDNSPLYSEVQFEDGTGFWGDGYGYRIASVTESDDGKTALITIASIEDDPVYYGQKSVVVGVLDNDGQAVLDLSQATNVELSSTQTCWVANGKQIKPEIQSFDVPVFRDGEQIGSQRCYSPQATSDFTVSYVDNVFGNATSGKGTIVVAASASSPYTGSFSYEFDIFSLNIMDLSQEGFTIEAVNPDVAPGGIYTWLVRDGGVRPDVRCVVNCEYNGQAVYEELDGSKLAALGLTLAYTNNTSAGTGHVTVSNSNSQRTVDFPIVSSVPIFDAFVSFEKDVYSYVLGVYPDTNNEADYTKPKLKESDVFKENTDFVYGGYTYSEPDENGNRQCTVRYRAAEGSTRYTNVGLGEGEWVESSVTLYNKKDFSKCQIKFVDNVSTYEYSFGGNIDPRIQLIAEDGQTVLVDSDSWYSQTDYYMNFWQEDPEGEMISPTLPGEATVEITCDSNSTEYLGEPLRATYTIAPVALSTERIEVNGGFNNLTKVPEGVVGSDESIGDWAAHNSSMSVSLGNDSYAWLRYGTDFEYESCEPEWTGQLGTYILTYKGIGGCVGTFTVPVIVVSNSGSDSSQMSLECNNPDNASTVFTDGDLELRLTTGNLGDNVTYEFTVEVQDSAYQYVPVSEAGYTVSQENRTITLHGANLAQFVNGEVRVSAYAKVNGSEIDRCERYISVYEPGSVYFDLRSSDATMEPTQWFPLPKSGTAYYRDSANPGGARFDYTTTATVSNQSPTYAGYDVARIESEDGNWKIVALNPGTATIAVERTKAEQMGGGTETVTFEVTVTEETSNFEAQIQAGKHWVFPNSSVTAQVTGSYQRWSVAKQEFETVDDGLAFEWHAASLYGIGEESVTVTPTVADGGRTAAISVGALLEGQNEGFVSIWVQPKHDGVNVGSPQYTSVDVVREHHEIVLNASTEDYSAIPVGGSFTVRPEAISYSADKVSSSSPDGRETLNNVTFTWSEWAAADAESGPPHSFDIVGPSADGTYTFTRLSPGWCNYQLAAYRDSELFDTYDLGFEAVDYDVRLSSPYNSVYADENLNIQFYSRGKRLPSNVEPTFDVKVQVGESSEWTAASESCYETGVHPYTSNYYVAIYGSKLSEAGVKRVKIGASVVVDGRTIECDPIEIDVLGSNNKANFGDATIAAIPSQTYTGSAIEPAVTVELSGETVPADEYTVSYFNNTNVGQATVTVTAKSDGNYAGSTSTTFTIVPLALASDGISVTGIAESTPYTGALVTMPVEVKMGDNTTLNPINLAMPNMGDYAVAYENNLNVGQATITITGHNNFTGAVTKTFQITPVALSGESVSVSGVADKEYTGSAITQEDLALTLGDYTLVENTDYTVAYANNTNKSTAQSPATITITAKSGEQGGSGNFTGTRTETFKITGKVLNETEFSVSAIDPATYTGGNITPEPTVTYGNRTLIKDTDYTLSYTNNKNVTTGEAKATVTITGIGDFGGELSRDFAINPATITQITGVQSLVYTGDALSQAELGVKAGDLDLGAGDYDVAYANNTDAGQATVAVTAKGNFTGELSQTFEIEPMSIAGATVTLADGPFTYTGSTIEPAVTSVSVGGKTVPASGYTVAYANNQDAGQATVTVTGTGNYKDVTTANFTIGKKSLEGATIASIPNKTYTGSAIEPAIAVVQDGTEVPADEYDVIYANNTNVAAADAAQPTVTATAKADGNYTGSTSATFRIVPRSLEDATVEGIASTVAFKNAAYEPVPTVTIGNKTLAKDTDYTVAYANNKDASSEGSKATVTIAGAGNYTGSKVVEFTISPAQITAVQGVANLTFTGDALTQTGLVVHAGDLELAATDYDVEYANNTNATTGDKKATVTVTAKGNYRGTLTEDFSIAKANMSSSALSVTGVVDKSYSGTPQTQDTLVAKLGSYALVEGRDYTVDYANNQNASTEQNKAKITLVGQGNFTGSRTVEFTIAGKSLSEATIDGIADQTYTGEAITPEVKVSIDDRLLVEDTDYTVSYGANNTNATDAATVTVTGIGNYVGEATTSFRIVPLSLARAVVTAGDQVFTGTALEPAPTVKVGEKTIDPSVYDVAYENNTNVGTATILVRPKAGQTNYADAGKGTFRIKTKSISEDDQLVVAAIADQPYTGSAIKPEVSVTLGGQAFPATNYTVSYSDNVNVGQATVTVTGKGSYSGTLTATFRIVPVNVANVTLSGIEDKMHTGEALTQSNLVLRMGNYVLKEGADYVVSYESNTNVGEATITITGAGNFTGTRTEHFNIGSLQIADIAAFTYDGTAHEPKPAVVAGEQTLTEGADFDYAWSHNVDAGTAKVTVTGKGEYAGSSANKEFAINPAPLSALAITAIGDQSYTGAAITPEVVITSLMQGRDYTVSYNNNVNAGVATAIATGTGNYAGKLTTTFGIGAKSLADADVSITDIPEQTYTGKAIKPAVEVRVGSEVLDPKNYEVAYENNTSTGTAGVTITGKGNYAGTKTASFTIAKQSLAAGNVLIGAISDQTYTGSEIRPVPTITVNGRKLDTSDTSKYEVTYGNNTNVGTATVTVKAIGGDYTGEKSQTFKIKVRNIADFDVAVADQTYTGDALTPELTLSRDGILSSENYDVEYANNSGAGVAVVTITGKENCTGTTTTTFSIAPAAITAVTGVADLDYTGTALTQSELVVKAGESLTLGAGDYDVTYANNTNATTADAKATVTVTGKGNFTGTQSAEFSIAPMSISGATVTLAQDSFVYNGSSLEPAVASVVVGGKTLGASDYDVIYANNTNATTADAKATVTVTGKGNCKDVATANFSIAKANLADVAVSGVADLQYKPGQSAYTQNENNIVLKLGDYTLRQGTDYTISYANHTGINGEQDLYSATLTIAPAGGNFEGNAVVRDYKVSKQLMTSENVQITRADNETYTYDGDPKRPAVSKVVYDGKELLPGIDYSVAYENNINAGEAAIAIKGQGAYAGEARQAFSIAPLDISTEGTQATLTGVPESHAFTGAAIKPVVAVTLGDVVLTKDVDYTVAYGENTNVTTDDAKAAVTVTGAGNYTGTMTATFAITARAITDATIEPIASTTFNSYAQTPAPVVKLDGQAIDPSNYTVSYTGNTNVGTATVTVVGGSNFAQGDDNSLSTTFAIAPARIDAVTGISSSLEYTGDDLMFPNLTVRSGLLTLAPNSYTVAYENNRNVGKAKVTVSAHGNYAGGGSFEFRITPKSIVDYQVVMPTNDDDTEIIYTETANLDAFEPTPIVRNAAGSVLDPSNYDVTYLNNSVAGTAQVIVTGKGNYTGSPSTPGEFTIVKFAGTAASDENNAVIWYVEDGGAMTITPKKKGEGADLGTATSLTWSQAVADYTTTVTVDPNVQNCQDASGMFSGLSNATSVDITSFDMQQVTNTSGMFEDCASLTTIDLTNKIGSSVTDMSRMFAGCESLTSIPLGTVDTSNVTNMSGMFADCASLSVNNLSELFLPSVSASSLSNETEGSGTPLLSTQGISAMSATGALNTENVTSMSEMFKGATGLTELDLNMLDTASVQDMSRMFAGCTNLRMLVISSFNTQSVNDMAGMYDECALNEYTIGSNYVSEQNNVVEALPTPTASNGLWWKTGTAAGNNGNCKWISDDGIRALGANANDTYANTGSLSAANVSIELADIATSGSSYTYDGSAKEPVVNRVVLKTSDGEEIELIPNADYEVSYNNNVNAGESAQVVVMGRGDYSGSAVQLFAIDKCDIGSATVTAENTAYTGSKATPAVTVTIGNKTLAKDTDYTVTCDSVNVGTGVVTVAGKGNYKGTNSAQFKIQAINRWLKEGDSWYYYGADGNKAKGWQKVGDKWYYFEPSTGAMKTGWLKSGSTWYYLTSSGAMAVGWAKVGNAWYYFNASGAMLTGWQKISSTWYYFASSGAMAVGWAKVGNAWYYFASSGAMKTGWQKIGSAWYYFASSGAMKTGWQKIGSAWYYFNGSGAMLTGWQKLGSTWYYFNSSGAMLTGRQSIGGKWYTFSSSGAWVA